MPKHIRLNSFQLTPKKQVKNIKNDIKAGNFCPFHAKKSEKPVGTGIDESKVNEFVNNQKKL